MKTEIEARLLDCNVEQVIEKLKNKNAKFEGDWLQLRYCYDFKPALENSWIRLRTNGKETTLTIKEINSSKIDGTKELEIVVSDFYETDLILNKLGFNARSKQENRRIRYTLDSVEIDIDFWPYIPPYVEFEADSEEDIIKVCKILGLEYGELTTLDVSSIYNKYGLNINEMPEVVLEENKKLSFNVEEME